MTYKRHIVFRHALLALLLLVFAAFSYGGNFSVAPVSAAEILNEFDKMNVLADLTGSVDLYGAPFFPEDYPKDTDADVRLINFVEYGYTFAPEKRDKFGLYLYVYNPSEKEIDTSSSFNRVQMAVSYDSAGKPELYEKFALQYCSKSTGDYLNRFYKFRIIDHESADGLTIANRVDRDQRRYDVSGVEFLYTGQSTAEDYGIGGTFTFTGYAAGCGEDPTAESTLQAETPTDLLTITLDLTQNPNNSHTTYRTDMENENMFSHNQIDSVYFSISDEILAEYGKLQKVMAEWWEYRTTPIIATEDTTTYNWLYEYLGIDLGGMRNDSVPLSMGTNWHSTGGTSTQSWFFDWAYNFNLDSSYYPLFFADEYSTMYSWLFSSNGVPIADYVISEEELLEYIDWYSTEFGSFDNPGYEIKDGKVSTDLFSTDVGTSGGKARQAGHNVKDFDADEDAFDMNVYEPELSGWDAFLDAFGWYDNNTDTVFTDITPIYTVTSADFRAANVAERLLIDADDVDYFKTYCEAEWDKGNTVFLFRFASTEYEATPLHVWHEGDMATDCSYMARENVFFDFDIIQFTFNDEGQYFVIPVVSSPIDIIPDIDPPPEEAFESDDGCFGLSWETLIMIAAGIVLLIILMPFLPTIASVIVWIISLPFKLIAGIVNGIKKAVNKPKKE